MSCMAQVLLAYPATAPAVSISNISPITATSPLAFSYITMPSGPRTFLNYITSFGITGSSSNTGSTTWNNSYSGSITYAASPITTNNYFTQFNRVLFIVGDGTADSLDWVVMNFGVQNVNADYDGTASTNKYFGGENTASGGSGGISGTPTGRLWGFNTDLGWQLLYQLPLGAGSGNGNNHTNGGWFTVGTPVTSGRGKRAAYNTYSITHVGFSAGSS